MNRAVATVLTIVCAALTAEAGLAPVGLAQVPETPEAKQRRIDTFQERRLIFEEKKEDNGSVTYSLRQGPDTIFDVDFVELVNDPSLTSFWQGERNRDWAYWLGSGAVAIPAGTMLFLNNFRGTGPLALFSTPSNATAANVSDWRTFSLSVLGIAVAAYGTVNISRWVSETLDFYHPSRLDKDSISPRVDEWNEKLRDRLNLEPADIPPPPSPRPSESPSPTASGSPGVDVTLPFASPPVDMTDDTVPSTMPVPLPVISPVLRPSALPSPSQPPRAQEFKFPGQPSPSPNP